MTAALALLALAAAVAFAAAATTRKPVITWSAGGLAVATLILGYFVLKDYLPLIAVTILGVAVAGGAIALLVQLRRRL